MSTYNAAPLYSYSITQYAPNGDVLAATDSVNGSWTYSYDPFNRLIGANQNSGAAIYSYVYDRFGNRWHQNGPNSFSATFTGGTPATPKNNNRMDGYSYDNSGNTLSDGLHAFTYDAENRLTSSTYQGATSTYSYDANDRRVHRTGETDSTCTSNQVMDYIYDLSGRWVLQVNSNGTQCSDEIYFGGRHLGSNRGGIVYSHTDWLGTERVRINSAYIAYRKYDQDCVGLPFGDGKSCTPAGSDPGSYASPIHFTGKERDSESGLDNFGARYLTSSMGRFMSPDWAATPDTVPYANFNEPQTLNLYTYGGNNPLLFGDPDGHNYRVCDTNGNNCADLTDAQYEQYRKDNPNIYSYGGNLYVSNPNGSETKVGTVSWYNEKDIQAAGMIGFGGTAMINFFLKNMAFSAAGGLAGRGIGWGIEALTEGVGDAVSTGTNVVYRSVNSAGDVQYVGITNDFARRAGEHAGRFVIEKIPGLSNLSAADARAVEQVLIETHGLASNGGTLLNKINSIASTNPSYAQALQRGAEILAKVGYFK